jgi:hypothetical protein
MGVFAEAEAAVRFAGDVTRALIFEDWEPETLVLPGMAPQSTEDGAVYFRGPAVAIGMSTGPPTMFSFNRRSGRMDYFGPVVNRAARVLGQAASGEICFSRTTYDALPPAVEEWATIESCGLHRLRGIEEDVELFHVLPRQLAPRFAIYRKELDIESEVVDDDSDYGPTSPFSPSASSYSAYAATRPMSLRMRIHKYWSMTSLGTNSNVSNRVGDTGCIAR